LPTRGRVRAGRFAAVATAEPHHIRLRERGGTLSSDEKNRNQGGVAADRIVVAGKFYRLTTVPE